MGAFSTIEPVGVMTDRIRAQFLNIVCNASAIEAIESCFRKAGLPIVRHTMAADRLANVMTDEKERSTGCAFVEMGSETTTVAVYRGKLLRHFAVLPLGGLNITRDIARERSRRVQAHLRLSGVDTHGRQRRSDSPSRRWTGTPPHRIV